jgi:hypothetical protein
MTDRLETHGNDGAPEREAQEQLTARVGTTLSQRKPTNLSWGTLKQRLRRRSEAAAK